MSLLQMPKKQLQNFGFLFNADNSAHSISEYRKQKSRNLTRVFKKKGGGTSGFILTLRI